MPEKLLIPKAILDEMILISRKAYPNEACAILVGNDNEVSKIYEMTNIEKSPVSYFMDSKEQFKVMKDIRKSGLSMLAIFHSHPSSPAYPSAKDISLAFYDNCIYIIASLIEKEPIVKGFLIKEGKVREVEIKIKS